VIEGENVAQVAQADVGLSNLFPVDAGVMTGHGEWSLLMNVSPDLLSARTFSRHCEQWIIYLLNKS